MNIFCCGIGGIGLSAYAALQAANGQRVSGSDRAESALLEDLRRQGIAVTIGQDGLAVPEDADLFVYSEAIAPDAPERVRAAALAVPQMSYFHALGDLTRGSRLISVCGTHGKSSTTAMAARVLIACGKDPSVVVGTKVRELDGSTDLDVARNWRKGGSDLFVVESCEYRRSFHFLSPKIVLMTNVDGDHFDAYGSIEEYQQAFVDFLSLLPDDGIVITHGRDPDCLRIAVASGRTMIDADQYDAPTLSTPGLHMRQNAQLVLALAIHLGIREEDARASLQGFAGTWRRMELLGTTVHDVPVIDDYGHHPAEIRATLRAMREEYPTKRIVCAFQPHTHDRTKKLYKDFLSAFSDADVLIIPNVYAARLFVEQGGEVDVQQLLADIALESHVEAFFGDGLEKTKKVLRSTILRSGDVLMVMGAGDITAMAHGMVSVITTTPD